MERHIQALLNRLSVASITIATITLVYLLSQTPTTCLSSTSQIHFPKSSCDTTHRELVSLHKKNKRIWSTNDWRKKLISYTHFFTQIQRLAFLHNDSKVLCVSAGAGHEVMAVSDLGVTDVTGVELIDSPPLVSRADPHNLPFFDGAFDLGFTAHFAQALFPFRFVSEMERTVRVGGVCVIVVEDCSDEDLRDIKRLFRRSSLVSVSNVDLAGFNMTRIIMRRITITTTATVTVRYVWRAWRCMAILTISWREKGSQSRQMQSPSVASCGEPLGEKAKTARFRERITRICCAWTLLQLKVRLS